jgi:periplasmic copper chaperone A
MTGFVLAVGALTCDSCSLAMSSRPLCPPHPDAHGACARRNQDGAGNENDTSNRDGTSRSRFRPLSRAHHRLAGPLSTVLLLALAAAPAAWAESRDAVVTQGRMQVLLPSRPAAGYFTLENRGDTPLTLIGASAPDCKSLMLHQSKSEGGIDRMTMVSSLPVPPHGTVRFAPGGYHLMCMQPSGPLLTHQGTETVTLHFADGGSISAPFAIQGPRR